MKILSAKIANQEGTAIIAATDERGEVLLPLDQPHWLTSTYEAWLTSGHLPTPYQAPAIDTIQLAEDHIGQYFSNSKQLMMKVWWDAIPHENLPRVAAIYQWVTLTTGAALQGATTFAPAPFTFAEVAEECVPQLTP